jgi:uncharacterized protein YerC
MDRIRYLKKLNSEVVRAIKERLLMGREPQKVIAQDFGVSQATISGIKRGKSWRVGRECGVKL